MPDDHDVENARSEFDLNELVGLIGNCYVRNGLSPPTQLHSAVKRWLGLTHREILAAIEQHFAEHRSLYTCGSGDGHFHLVEADIRKAWQAKHPPLARADDEPVQPRRKRAGVRKVYPLVGGPPDLIVDDPRAARLLRDQAGPVNLDSNLRGYENHGVPINLGDDETEAVMRAIYFDLLLLVAAVGMVVSVLTGNLLN